IRRRVENGGTGGDEATRRRDKRPVPPWALFPASLTRSLECGTMKKLNVHSLGWLLITVVAVAVIVGRGDFRIAYGAGPQADQGETSDSQADEKKDAAEKAAKESDQQTAEDKDKNKNAK